MDTYNQNNIIVQEPASEFRRLARLALDGLWKKAIVGVLIYQGFMVLVPGLISHIVPGLNHEYTYYNYLNTGMNYTIEYSPFMLFYRFFLAGPFVIGFIKYILQIVRRREVDISLIFKGFEHTGKAFLLTLAMGFFGALWTLPFFLLLAIGFAFSMRPLIMISIIGIVFMAVWAAFRYVLATYYMADDWNYRVVDAIKLSAIKMNGNKFKLLCIRLSFIGWLMLAGLISSAIQSIFIGPTGIVSLIIDFISNIPMYVVLLYINTSDSFFYEIVSEHLVKQSNA